LNLPVLGQDVAVIAWQYPFQRNLTLRLLEPLGAQEDTETGVAPGPSVSEPAVPPQQPTAGVHLTLENVSVRVAGHTVLEDINLDIQPCSHIAIVGASGAGKSTLAGILLGWHRPASGRVLADHKILDGAGCARLRHETAWVEPAVQLWNRSLLDNIRYGSPETALPDTGLFEQACLHELLEKLPEGLQNKLGEGGALVSGGEGQRVRLARGLMKPGARLAIMDEPFRGLDRQQRHELLSRARNHWRAATLLCITHDVRETMAFPRVLVMEAGRIVEDGSPADLVAKLHSRYRQILDAENAVRNNLWSSPAWRHLRLEDGKLREYAAGASA
jgi:ABC-type transport system involved in cytochrome bd biosynthesis fused ATPase/permease subunit